MSEVGEDRAGTAFGLMSAAHEIGAAFGVAVFSAVAVVASGGISVGYRHGFDVAVAIAAGMALLATVSVPVVRPAAGARVAGVSRVTVYAHFPTWEALLEAAVERAVQRTMAALEAARPADGRPLRHWSVPSPAAGSTWPDIRRWPRPSRNCSARRP